MNRLIMKHGIPVTIVIPAIFAWVISGTATETRA
jgi:hypothetical protein